MLAVSESTTSLLRSSLRRGDDLYLIVSNRLISLVRSSRYRASYKEGSKDS